MHWIYAGLVMFSFAGPSAVVGVPYSIGSNGIILGSLACILVSIASVIGALLLGEMARSHPTPSLPELGGWYLGRKGQLVGDVVQMGNFLLFLPVALRLCSGALQDLVDADGSICSDYFLFGTSIICLCVTQFRDLKNTAMLSLVCAILVFVIGFFEIHIVATSPTKPTGGDVHLLAGNGADDGWQATGTALLGVTTAAWGYVPSFLAVELVQTLEAPETFRKSVLLSGALNVAVYIGFGVTVAGLWGWNIPDPITISPAWPTGTAEARVFSALVLLVNLTAYALDSIPLVRYFQRTFFTEFDDKWTVSSILRYLGYSVPTWLFALVLAVFVPNVFVMLTFVTFLTVPAVTQIYPSILALACLDTQARSRHDPLLSQNALPFYFSKPYIWFSLTVGICSFLMCFAAAIFKVALPDLRGPAQIGCDEWLLMDGW